MCVVFALVFLLASVAVPAEAEGPGLMHPKAYNGWNVYRLIPAAGQEILLEQMLNKYSDVDVWQRKQVPEIAWDVLIPPDVESSLLSWLSGNGIPYEVVIADVGQLMRSEKTPESSRRSGFGGGGGAPFLTRYLRYAQMMDYVEKLVRRHPDIANIITFGRSGEGRPMKVVRISTAAHAPGRPIILIDAGIHAREWISPSMALYILYQLLENPENRDLLVDVDWHIIPLLNPDGYEYSHTTDRMWRKTRSNTNLPQCPGVDANRNFDIHWGTVGVSWNPCKEIFAGPKPFSEIESQNLRNYALVHKDRIKLYVTIHSYGGYAIYPWGFSYTKPDDASDLHALGQAVANAVMNAGIPKFTTGNCQDLLGSVASGGSDDWMKGVLGVKYAYTIEMPTSSFTTPAAEIAQYVVPTFEGFRVFGKFINELYGRGLASS